MTWLDAAACKGQPTELFLGELGVNPKIAKGICERCPVRFECVSAAVNENDWDTVRGGMSAHRRRRCRRILQRIVWGADREAFDHLVHFSKQEFALFVEREAAA